LRVGIDLGTTYSLIAYLGPKGAPTLFPDLHDASAFRTPSVVHLGPSGVLIGDPVEQLLRSEPDAPVVRFGKLVMGRDEVLLEVGGVPICPTTAAALVLRKLKRDAEAFANEAIEACVICVPAQFGDAERRATRDAALAAGLPLPELADEPVAAGVYHGLDRGAADEVLLVYDLGGGTFDATVLRRGPDGLRVLATEGDNRIGGAGFDRKIGDLLVSDMKAAGDADPRRDPSARERLRRFAEEAKIALSRRGVDRLEEDLRIGGSVVSFVLTEHQLEDALAPEVERTLEVTATCLRAAGLTFEQVDRVLLAGGSTLLPLIQRAVQDRCGKVASQVLIQQPHQAVAFGAALLAARRSERADDLRVTASAGHDLCLRVMDRATRRPALKVLIPRQTPLPASTASTFVTTRDDQQRMIFEIVQARDDDERSLGHFAFGPIESPRKGKPMELSVGYDEQGLVRARVRDPESGRELEHLLGDGERTDAARVARVRAVLDRLDA